MIKFKYVPDFENGTKSTSTQTLFKYLIYITVLLIGLIFAFIFDDIGYTYYELFSGYFLIFAVVSTKIYKFSNSKDYRDLIPLHLCDISSLSLVYMIFSGNYYLFPILFYWALTGAIQGLISGTINIPVNHFRFISFYFNHAALAAIPISILFHYDFDLTFLDSLYSGLYLIGLGTLVIIINTIIDGEYMFVSLRRDVRIQTRNLLSLLGPFPFYIIPYYILVVINMLIVHIPFHFIA